MSSQLATWQHVTTQFECDVTNRTCLNTIDANMCGAFKTKHTQPFQHPIDISHTRPKQKRSNKNTKRQTNASQPTSTTPTHNDKWNTPAQQHGTNTEKATWETTQTHEHDDEHLWKKLQWGLCVRGVEADQHVKSQLPFPGLLPPHHASQIAASPDYRLPDCCLQPSMLRRVTCAVAG